MQIKKSNMQTRRWRHRGILVTFSPANSGFPYWGVGNEADTFPPSSHPQQCPACNIRQPLSLRLHNPPVGKSFVKQAFSFAPLERAASDCRTCRTSCFSAGALTTTCPRRWPIGWGWNSGKWSRRSLATRRRGEYVATACRTLIVALFADSGAFKRDRYYSRWLEASGSRVAPLARC